MMPRWGLLAGLLVLAGCTHPQTRLQSADEGDRERDAAEVKTIGDITVVTNVEAVPVAGVGLVTRLENTGGGAPPGLERTALEEYLRKEKVTNVQELLNSNTTSLVRVAARIPVGVRKGDQIDVFVTAPEASRTTSLRGGVLEECVLFNYDSTNHVSAAAGASSSGRPDQLLRGHALVKADGAVIAGINPGQYDDEPSLRQGVVWAGGRYTGPDQPLILEINPDQQSVKVAVSIAERINATFQGTGVGLGSAAVAEAKTKSYVTLNVPGAYRLYKERFLRVVRLIPLNVAPVPDSDYCRKQAQKLLDPAETITAALRLEALGAQSIPALKVGLHSESSMVRFAAAEALAYLGSPSCGEELGKQVAEHPYVQAYALTALASLNEAVCRVKLQELLSAPSPETRYGAFRALQARDGRDPIVTGQKLGTFWLHEVAKTSAPQIHIATTKRPEVVLFGDRPSLVPPFALLAEPEFTLRAEEGASTCTLTRFTTRNRKQSKQCSLEVADVLRALAELGGNYADAVELLRQAESCRGLNCAVKVDAMPKAPTVYDLARAGVPVTGGKGDVPGLLPADIGTTPTLYQRPTAAQPAAGPE